jgi:heat shock protein HslJ
VVLLCGATAGAAPAAKPGRRGKQSTPAEAAPEPPKAAPTPLDGGRWQLTSYRGADGNPVTPIDGDRPTIRFRSGRIITGSGGCNTFTAAYTYDAGRLTVSHAAVSSGTCPDAAMDQETAYLAALHHVASFALNENVLSLDDGRGVSLLTFEREPPKAVTGTDWHMTAYDDGKGGFPAALPGIAVTATFAADGTLRGWGGCNEYRGKYTQTGDTLQIGPLILLTKKACAPEARDQERAFLSVLRSATRAEGPTGQLLLTRAGDARVASFQPAAAAPSASGITPPPLAGRPGTSR